MGLVSGESLPECCKSFKATHLKIKAAKSSDRKM